MTEHDFSATITRVIRKTVFHANLPDDWNANVKFAHRLDWIPWCAACQNIPLDEPRLLAQPELFQIAFARGGIDGPGA